MAAKKRRRKPGVLWRVLFEYNGPTRANLRKLFAPSTFTLHVRDPHTGVVRKKLMRVDAEGRLQECKPPAKKKPAAKKQTSAKRGGSQPSRASKSGSTPRRSTTSAGPAARRGKPVPLADRVLRNPDGTLAGSRPASPEQQLRRAEAEYRKALKNAGAAGRRAEELLGWRTPRR